MNLSFLTAPILKYVSGGLAVALALTVIWGWRVDSLRAGYKVKLTDAIAYQKAFESAIVARTAEYIANANAAKQKKDAENAEKARVADANIADLRSRYRAVVLRAAAAGSPGSAADLSGVTQGSGLPTAGPEDTGVPDGSILISVSDALDCGELAAYASGAHSWAISLSP